MNFTLDLPLPKLFIIDKISSFSPTKRVVLANSSSIFLSVTKF